MNPFIIHVIENIKVNVGGGQSRIFDRKKRLHEGVRSPHDEELQARCCTNVLTRTASDTAQNNCRVSQLPIGLFKKL